MRADREPPRTDSRRSILRRGATCLALGTSLTGGCLSDVPGLDGDEATAPVSVPPGGSPSFRNWVPADGVLGFEQFDPAWLFLPGEDWSDALGRPFGIGREVLVPCLDYFGVGFEEYDRAVMLSDAAAMEGPFDSEDVGETLRTSGYRAVGQYQGYDRYERSDLPRSCAVQDGRVVFASGDRHWDRVRAIVDARAGRVERRHEAVPSYRRLTDRSGARRAMQSDTGASFLLPQATAWAQGFALDESGFYMLYYGTLPRGDDLDRSAVEDRVAEGVLENDATTLSVAVEDRVALVALRESLSSVRNTIDDERPFPPQITWGIEAVDGGILIRHEAGDTVPVARLEVDGENGTVDLPVQGDRTLAPGDEVELDLETIGSEFTLFWNVDDGPSAMLFEHELS